MIEATEAQSVTEVRADQVTTNDLVAAITTPRTRPRRPDSPATEAAPTIPAQQPAAIEPVWSKAQLKLPKSPAKSDLKGRKFTAALKSLREEMRPFADEIAGEANIDRRFVAQARKLADQIPQKSPTQAELFRLGHAGEVFAGYARTVDDEWPGVPATRFHALALHFDRIMRQSPLWREFKRNAVRQTLTAQQVGTAASLAAATATALRNDEAAVLVHPSIPQALEHLAVPLQAVVVIAAPFLGLLSFYPEAFAWLTTGALASLIRRRR